MDILEEIQSHQSYDEERLDISLQELFRKKSDFKYLEIIRNGLTHYIPNNVAGIILDFNIDIRKNKYTDFIENDIELMSIGDITGKKIIYQRGGKLYKQDIELLGEGKYGEGGIFKEIPQSIVSIFEKSRKGLLNHYWGNFAFNIDRNIAKEMVGISPFYLNNDSKTKNIPFDLISGYVTVKQSHFSPKIEIEVVVELDEEDKRTKNLFNERKLYNAQNSDYRSANSSDMSNIANILYGEQEKPYHVRMMELIEKKEQYTVITWEIISLPYRIKNDMIYKLTNYEKDLSWRDINEVLEEAQIYESDKYRLAIRRESMEGYIPESIIGIILDFDVRLRKDVYKSFKNNKHLEFDDAWDVQNGDFIEPNILIHQKRGVLEQLKLKRIYNKFIIPKSIIGNARIPYSYYKNFLFILDSEEMNQIVENKSINSMYYSHFDGIVIFVKWKIGEVEELEIDTEEGDKEPETEQEYIKATLQIYDSKMTRNYYLRNKVYMSGAGAIPDDKRNEIHSQKDVIEIRESYYIDSNFMKFGFMVITDPRDSKIDEWNKYYLYVLSGR